MRRACLLTSLALVAVACAPVVGPQGDFSEYDAAREEALRGGPVILPPSTIPPETEAERLARETREALGGTAVATGTLPPPVPGAPPPAFPPNPVEGPISGPIVPGAGATAPAVTAGTGISQEQDFGAVSAQRSIEADAQRLEAARAQRIEVQPRAIDRPDEVGANVISYAIEEARPVGAAGTFPRGAFASQRRAEGRCQAYRTADDAQSAFLGAGGPTTDRLGVDPDGDGNACGWNPATYQGLVQR
jgi:hypothetical protein